MKYGIGLFLAAALPAVHGVAFAGPEPTAIDANRAFGSMNPKPTEGPSLNELKKRQSLDPETCGWVDADFCMLPRHFSISCTQYANLLQPLLSRAA